MLTALETETDATTIAAIVTEGFSVGSDGDSHRQVLFRFAADAGNDTNQLITTFTPDILSGFQAFINDPSPETTSSQAQQISAIR
jgi:hypothetical protein